MRSLRVLSGALVLSLLLGSCAAPEMERASHVPAACAIPADVTPAPARTAPADEIVLDEPQTGYLLALTWAPEICRTRGEEPENAIQCRQNDFGFVLHGLWPSGKDRRSPRYCRPAPPISAATVRKHLCMTPSPAMLQHEWAAHGTCGWDRPEAYFADAAKLWDQVAHPVLGSTTMTAAQLRDAFTASNPHLRRDGIYIKAAGGKWLEDVRFCYDLDYRPTACRSIGAPDHLVLQLAPRRGD